MQGTQSVIDHRDNANLNDGSTYLSVLCSHLVSYNIIPIYFHGYEGTKFI